MLKNDEANAPQVMAFDKILFSPGPGIPSEAGNMCNLIKEFAGNKPMLGICLGHQAIAEDFVGHFKILIPCIMGGQHRLQYARIVPRF